MLAGRVLKGLEIERLKRDFRSQKIQKGLEIERLKRDFETRTKRINWNKGLLCIAHDTDKKDCIANDTDKKDSAKKKKNGKKEKIAVLVG